MSSLLGYLWTVKEVEPIDDELTVAVAESVTAGALTNALCSEPGASTFFKGGIVAYNVASKRDILGIDVAYAESHNFANPFTTSEMARSVAKMFKSRIGIATTGYSLPFQRDENKDKGECALDIEKPYAYICLFDAKLNKEVVKRLDFQNEHYISQKVQRATVQTKVALEGKRLFLEYKEKLSKID